MKKPNKNISVTKIVDELDDILDRINQISVSYRVTDPEKMIFFSNTSFELHKITEELDEFNLNNP